MRWPEAFWWRNRTGQLAEGLGGYLDYSSDARESPPRNYSIFSRSRTSPSQRQTASQVKSDSQSHSQRRAWTASSSMSSSSPRKLAKRYCDECNNKHRKCNGNSPGAVYLPFRIVSIYLRFKGPSLLTPGQCAISVFRATFAVRLRHWQNGLCR